MGTFSLKLHQGLKSRTVAALQDILRLHVKALQLVDRQVNPPAQRVFTDIANDVGELKRQSQGVGISCGGVICLSKNVGSHFAHNACHQMTISL